MLDQKQYFNCNIYIISHSSASHTFYSVFCSQFCFWFLAFFTCFFFFFSRFFLGVFCLFGPGAPASGIVVVVVVVVGFFFDSQVAWRDDRDLPWNYLLLFTSLSHFLSLSLCLTCAFCCCLRQLKWSCTNTPPMPEIPYLPCMHASYNLRAGNLRLGREKWNYVCNRSQQGGGLERAKRGVCVCVDVAA